jgi:hypothetical protein
MKMPSLKLLNGKTILIYLLTAIVSFLVRGAVVYGCYNYIVPKLVVSKSNSKNNVYNTFRSISYSDSLVLVILVSSLLKCN